jgi:hypothetical protein
MSKWVAKIHDSHLIDGRPAECIIWDGDEQVCRMAGPHATVARHSTTGFTGERVPGPNAKLIEQAPQMYQALLMAKDILDHPEQRNGRAWTFLEMAAEIIDEVEDE